MNTNDLRAVSLTALLGGAGVMHLVKPSFFDPLVPESLGSPRAWVYGSGVVELASAALLARRSTRRVGGYLATATFIGVFPGNIKGALDGGVAGANPPFDGALAAWLRLPLQAPMVRAAWRVARAKP